MIEHHNDLPSIIHEAACALNMYDEEVFLAMCSLWEKPGTFDESAIYRAFDKDIDGLVDILAECGLLYRTYPYFQETIHVMRGDRWGK